jgi:hypothetical protein
MIFPAEMAGKRASLPTQDKGRLAASIFRQRNKKVQGELERPWHSDIDFSRQATILIA